MEILGILFFIFVMIGIVALPVLFLIKLVKLFKQKDVIQGEESEKTYLPYYAKKYFFSRSEQEFFNILNAELDAQRYTVFPKVRLGDFIEVDYNDRRNRTWWNKIRAKHIDFLIWDLVEKKIVLAIELDGNSHGSGKMTRRDGFVNDLYNKVGIRLERVKVGSNFLTEIKKIVEFN